MMFQTLNISKLEIIGFISTLLLMAPLASSSDQDLSQAISKEQYVFWNGGSSEARKAYESELLRRVFLLSESKFGASELIISERDISTKRALVMMPSGKIDIQSAPLAYFNHSPNTLNIIPIQILRNILGYRQLVINKDNQEYFKKIKTVKDFKKLVPGQGQEWGDIKIYEANGFQVEQATSLHLLFEMLEHKRFDYIPLCACEVNAALSSYSKESNALAIAENIVIYYPFPVYFAVHSSDQELYERISHGLTLAEHNGDMDRIFYKHFGNTIRKLNQKTTRVIALNTPGIEKYQKNSNHLLLKATVLE